MIPKLPFSRLKIASGFIYFIPIIILLIFVANFSVNVPYWDQWNLVDLFEKVSTGKASFEDFFSQNNEHRIVFPKLIIVSLAFISKWNVRYELYFSIFLATITFLSLYKLSRLSIKNKLNKSEYLNNILTCILIFSLIQHENWLWGFQIAWFLVNTCLVVAVLIIALSNNYPKILYLASIPCFIASFSSAHGLLTWLAVVPAIASLDGKPRNRNIRILIWLLLFAGTSALYFIGYQKPPHDVDTLFLLKEPLLAGKYFFALLGTPFIRQADIAAIIGLIIFLIFLVLSIHSLKINKSKFEIHSAAPWISIGLFALLFAFITTVGRASLGVDLAMSSRYTTSSVLLIISTTHLWRLFSLKNVFIISIIIGFILTSSIDAITQASLFQLQRQVSTTCLELVNFIDESLDSCLGGLYPSPTRLRQLTSIVESLGFRQFPKDITFITKPTEIHGYIDSPPTGETPLTVSKSGSLNMRGWAILPDSRELPKTVMFSYGNNILFFANAVVNLDSPDVAKSLNSSRYKKVRWAVDISPKSLPLGETIIKAWVYDSLSKQLIKLSGEPKVKVVE